MALENVEPSCDACSPVCRSGEMVLEKKAMSLPPWSRVLEMGYGEALPDSFHRLALGQMIGSVNGPRNTSL